MHIQSDTTTGSRRQWRLPGRLMRWGLLLAVLLFVGRPTVSLLQRYWLFAEIERRGGRIETKATRSVWLRDQVGPERLKHIEPVESVSLGNVQVEDNFLLKLRRIQGSPQLCINTARFSSAGMGNLTQLTNFRSIEIRDTFFQDSDLIHLEQITNLGTLILDTLPVSDDGLMQLRPLKSLHHLGLFETAVSDAGLSHLAGLTDLRVLNLARTRISDSGLVHLSGMTELRSLWLSSTRIGDAGLVHLKGMKRLRTLLLDDTRVTDAGLQHLADCRRLRWVFLHGTAVTRAGIKRLETDVPGCRVSPFPVPHPPKRLWLAPSGGEPPARQM